MSDWPLIGLTAALLGPAGVILLLGPGLSRYADAIGRELGIGKSLAPAGSKQSGPDSRPTPHFFLSLL